VSDDASDVKVQHHVGYL